MPKTVCFERSPLIEAICEFRFVAGESGWDGTIPGLFWDRWRTELPKKQDRHIVHFDTQQSPEEISAGFGAEQRMQFLSKDGKRMALLGANVLSLHLKQPYSNWEDFRAFIGRALEDYRAIAAPKKLERVGLRYINRIEVPEGEKVTDFLTHTPTLPGKRDQKWATWGLHAEIPHDKARALMIYRLGQAPSPPGGLLLDMDFSTGEAHRLPFKNVMSWVEIAHSEIEKLFLESLTPHARQSFGEVK